MKFRMTMLLGLVLLVGHLAGCGGGGGGGDDDGGGTVDSDIDFVRPAVISTTRRMTALRWNEPRHHGHLQ